MPGLAVIFHIAIPTPEVSQFNTAHSAAYLEGTVPPTGMRPVARAEEPVSTRGSEGQQNTTVPCGGGCFRGWRLVYPLPFLCHIESPVLS